MDPKLRAMLVGVGVVVLGGTGFYLYTPQPATRSMAELRDAGIATGQNLVLICPEQITAQTRRRIDRNQPGFLRPRQMYARVARVARCWNPDGGNCFRPGDWAVRVADLEGEVVVPSLRKNLVNVDVDAGLTADDGGESDEVDDAWQFRLDDCRAERCSTYDAGALNLPFGNALCGTLNRLWAEVPPCVLPMCWTLPDGGWDDHAGEPGHTAAPDCGGIGPYGEQDGGYRFRGCNVTPAIYSAGTQCLPVECGVVAGDSPPDVLGGL